jgi:CRP-like cAMP-binding protein
VGKSLKNAYDLYQTYPNTLQNFNELAMSIPETDSSTLPNKLPFPCDFLSEEEKKTVLRREVKKGDVLYREGESPRGLYYVCSGLFGLTLLSENGAESLVRVFPSCSYLGHRSLLADENYHATAQALKTSEVIFFPKEIALKLFKQNPNVLLAIARLMAIDLKNAENRLNDMVGKRAFARVAEALIFLKHKNEEFPWTRREIGEFCGVKTETVSRVLSELEDQGHIKKEGRLIKIINEAALLEELELN